MEPFGEVAGEYIKLPNLTMVKLRQSTSNDDADQEPILLFEVDRDKIKDLESSNCCPFVVAIQMARLISAATYTIEVNNALG